MRSPVPWKVPIQSLRAGSPTARSMRSRISLAARLVKVKARIWCGGTPSRTRRPMRSVSTRVLPLPAPASTRSGPAGCSTAERWASLSVVVVEEDARRSLFRPDEPQVRERRPAQVEDSERHRPGDAQPLEKREARLEVHDRHARALRDVIRITAHRGRSADLEELRIPSGA